MYLRDGYTIVGDGFLGGLRFFRPGGGVLVGAAGVDLRHNKFLLPHTVAALPDLVGSFFPEHDRACMLTMALGWHPCQNHIYRWIAPQRRSHSL